VRALFEEINTHAKINSKSGSRLECLNQKGIFMSLRRWSFLPLGFELKFHQSFEYPNHAVAEVSFLHFKTWIHRGLMNMHVKPWKWVGSMAWERDEDEDRQKLMVKGCLHVGLMMKSQGLKLKRYLLVLLLIHGQREQEGCVFLGCSFRKWKQTNESFLYTSLVLK
jgi:hypothetical protein